MGAFWIIDLGLGKHYRPQNAFHLFCRAQGVEGRVRRSGGGFELLRELQALFAASPERARYQEQASAAAGAPKGKVAKRKVAAATPASKAAPSVAGVTRSGKRYKATLLALLALMALLAAAEPGALAHTGPQPPQYRNLTTTSIFWPNDEDANGLVYPCTYIPTLCLANRTRLLAHGMCATSPEICNHIHLTRGYPPGPIPTGSPQTAQWAGFCQKHSDDGGKTWSQIRRIVNQTYPHPGAGMQLGMVVWDAVHQSVILQYPSPDVHQIVSRDLGQTWSAPRNLSAFLAPVFVNDKPTAWLNVGPGAGIQLSASNRFHPYRLLFAGHYGDYEYVAIWWSDDGGQTYELAKQGDGQPLKLLGQNEPALAETPDGGVLVTSRNRIFHGQGRCNCRGSARSLDGGETFGQPHPDPVLVEPICQGTMLGQASLVFHANPGHGTPAEAKGPPNGRASGTLRRSEDGGRTWKASLELNGDAAFSYSCLSAVPQVGMIGLAWETVLPGSRGVKPTDSANNVLFTLIPANFTNTTNY